MPQDTALVYNRREGFESGINHTNADRLFQHMIERMGRPVLQVPSNLKSSVNSMEKQPVLVRIMHVPFKSFYSPITSVGFHWNRNAIGEHICSMDINTEISEHHGFGDIIQNFSRILV